MIISDKHKFVFIGIPRTGSKSMNHWLTEYYDGYWHGGHHDYVVPAHADDYFKFAVVRNPYDRTTSGHFAVTWDDQAPKDHELEGCKTQQEKLRKFREVLKSREKQKQNDMPRQSDISLEQRIQEAKQSNEVEGHGINQKRFVERGKVDMVLYFERLPECLEALPFVDGEAVPPFPYHPERGIKPEGDFFKFFKDTDQEQVVWAHAEEDFEIFAYRRYESGLPKEADSFLNL